MKNCFAPKEFSGSDIEKINAARLVPGSSQAPVTFRSGKENIKNLVISNTINVPLKE